jgi:hypothetical protein
VLPVARKNDTDGGSFTINPAANAPTKTAGQYFQPQTSKAANARPPGIQKIVALPFAVDTVSTSLAKWAYQKARAAILTKSIRV